MAVTYGEGKDSGVIIGADSRTSTGSYVANRVSDKLTPVHDSIYCCRSGSTADTQAVADYVRQSLAQHAIQKGKPPAVKTAAHLFKNIVYSNKDKLSASIICAGWDPVRNIQCAFLRACGCLCVLLCLLVRACACLCFVCALLFAGETETETEA